MKKLGLIGWRGMVGSVLMERMEKENDFAGIHTTFFSTSNAGGHAPVVAGSYESVLVDAFDIEALAAQDIIISCQGGDYTSSVFNKLREAGWQGYWIDAASTLRMDEDAMIILDPVNREIIDQSLERGIKNFIGGNCTVSLMLMALGSLFKEGLVEWATSMTYQSASGAGAQNMKELLEQMGAISSLVNSDLYNPAKSILEIDQMITDSFMTDQYPRSRFGVPLAGSLIPWIDSELENGQSREEWKAMAESNKLLQLERSVPIDGTCVRVGAMRCHSQGLTVKLTKDVPLDDIEAMIKESNRWVKVVPNHRDITMQELTPAATSGTMTIPVGRLRKMNLGPEYLNAFTVGDQLLWGAAEPLRRMLNILLEREESLK
ncbi:aspartate-semialdehyde dehydrogenase [Ignatzschineria sp. F8392]|uniref:aspartate-semialdehyde dehydrogenase n=1 Tax=Ignatzschineria sp. F8392 TaxID=1980117 RepID=UPI000B97F383|nr:aspartate-semialdehyde dehydrogenase [Ignatzschineria sp. F8392]OYQ81822.1 aspartate-semialdehyde dehydrogenase [Ignatzschineria sp. F8392]